MNHATRDDRPKTPEALREAARELRATGIPEGFSERLSNGLLSATRQEAAAGATRAHWRMRGTGAWLALVPGIAGVALVLHLALADGSDEVAEEMWHHAKSQELHLVLDANVDGHSWVDLALLTHHHAGAKATVRVDAPHDVRVVLPEHAEHRDDSPQCADDRCVHRFSHGTHHEVNAPLQVGVTQPGRYRISVEHASPARRVREVFVVNARR
jgi:hypothetical protein